MKQLGRSIFLLLISVLSLSAQDPKPDPKAATTAAMVEECKCTIIPFKPEVPCFNYCATSLVARATLEELLVAFDLEEASARRIVAWEDRNEATSLEDYVKAHQITEAEAQGIRKRINSLDKAQLEYFRKPRWERVLIMTEQRKQLFVYE